MLGDVTAAVNDGLLGFETEKGTGIFVAVGASPSPSTKPITITGNMGTSRIRELLGLSPLADSVMDSLENGANRIYCIPVAAATAGTAGEIKKTGTGTGTCTVSGKPNNSYQVIVEFTGKGGFNSALFIYSLNGGHQMSEEVTLPLTGTFELPGTGLTLNFTQDTQTPEESFKPGDRYTLSTTPPQMTNADVLKVVGQLKEFNESFEFVHIIGESAPAMWAAVSQAQADLETLKHKPLLFILEAGKPEESESVEDYVSRLSEEKRTFKNKNISVVAARALYMRMDGTTAEINTAGIICGLLARTNVHQSIGRTSEAAGMGISKEKMPELRPPGIKEYLETLDNAKYITFR